MGLETMRHCWDIMQCDEEESCPVRDNKIAHCWEWMQKHTQFQSQYGLCAECIVFLSKNENTILAAGDIEQIMISRGLFQEDTLPCRRDRRP
ncbi:MAG: hypothetical protein ACYDBT_08745 [Desulfobulbaceae bacterium]